MNRGEAATAIWRAAGSPSAPFGVVLPYHDKDHIAETWYADAIKGLYAKGVLTADDAVADGSFVPEDYAMTATVVKWLKALKAADNGSTGTPSNPGGDDGGDTGDNTGGNGGGTGGTTTVEVNTGSITEGTKAKAEVNSENMNKAVESAVTEAAKQETAPVVEVKVETAGNTDTLEVALPAESLKTLAETENASLVIVSDIAEITLDNAALDALVGQATGSTVTLEVAPVEEKTMTQAQQEALTGAGQDAGDKAQATVVDLSLVSNGSAIHDYKGGKLTVTLPYALPEGRRDSDVRIYYLSDEGKLERHRGSSFRDGKVTFATTHLSKYVISAVPLFPEFTDVSEDSWYIDAVDWSSANSIVKGYGSADIFAPLETCDRRQIVTFLYRLAGEPEVPAGAVNPFTDVAEDAYYYNAVLWAAGKGITEGYGDAATFAPAKNVPGRRSSLSCGPIAANGPPAAKMSSSTWMPVPGTRTRRSGPRRTVLP